MTENTLTWWSLLCAVAMLNLVAWSASASVLRRRHALSEPAVRLTVRLQMLLSAGYMLGCAYRSVFPVFDVPRLCLVDSWLSSVAMGRSVATVAELCFAAQWALLLRGVARDTGSPFGVAVSWALVPLICVAEMFSWYSVLTTANIGHVVEESLWGLCGTLLVISFILVWPRADAKARPLLATGALLALGYALYMFQVDVPMYWSRWVLDSEHGRQYLSITQGLLDTSSRWIVSHRWDDWKTEVVWMSVYFSVAVWLSISLMHLPVRWPARRAQLNQGYGKLIHE
jgi:hypothetical protein